MGTVKYTGPVASFHCPTNAEIRSLKVHFSPKQEGSGDPSPENVRPIVGWDGVEVYRNNSTTDYEFGVLGKNKFNGTIVNQNIDSKGKILATDLCRLSSLYVPISSGTYTLSSAENYPTAVYVYKEDNDDSFITNESLISWNESPVTFTINEGKYVSIKWKKEDGSQIAVSDISNIQLELGSTATEYEPYDPNHTVYGGWVDLISGEVCEEWIKAVCNDSSLWEESSGTQDFRYAFNFTGRKRFDTSYEGLICSSFLIDSSKAVYARWTSAGIDRIGIKNKTTSYALTDIQQMAENGDISICYELATPNTYHIATTQLQTFLGQNNVWSNADYVEVEYDLHETQDILARKQFIIANQPHLVNLAAAPLQNFVTDMVAPLKECKVYFSPVQEGKGDPSPDNIRAISGWNGIKLWTSGKNMLPDWKSIYVNRRQNGETFNGITYSFTDNGFQLTGTATTSGRANLGGSGKENAFTENNSPILKGGYSYIISYNKTGSLLGNGSGQVENRSGWIQPGYAFELTKDGRAWLYHSLTTEEGLTYNEKIEDVQLELGSTATDYEPYRGQTSFIDWSSTAGTIYGGYVDLVTGELIATYGIVDLGTLTYTHRPDFGNGAAFSASISTTSLQPKDRWTGICNSYPYLGIYNNFTNVTCGIGFIYNNNIIIKDINVTTNDASVMKAALNGVMLCYELATPIVYQLTSIQLKTLRGTNNIWSNANGNIELKYWAH